MIRRLAEDSPVTSSLTREEAAWSTEDEATRPVPQTAASENLALKAALAMKREGVTQSLHEQAAGALNDSDGFHPPY